MKTTIKIEKTDTFGGEANYSWVERYELDAIDGESSLTFIRRVKKVIGWTGVKCKKTDFGDLIELRPIQFCNVVFITFQEGS
jgi:hypothetical protein